MLVELHNDRRMKPNRRRLIFWRCWLGNGFFHRRLFHLAYSKLCAHNIYRLTFVKLGAGHSGLGKKIIMNNLSTPSPGKASLEEELRLEIKVVAGKATAEDRKMLEEILGKARSGQRESNYFVITAPMAATLFAENNPHNRDWNPNHSIELKRQMLLGQSAGSNATIGFYQDGILADGAHRCAAAALAGFTFEVIIIFGIERKAIVTVDSGKVRYAKDAMKLEGIADAALEEIDGYDYVSIQS